MREGTPNPCTEQIRMIVAQSTNMTHGPFIITRAFEDVIGDHAAVDCLDPCQRAAFNATIERLRAKLAQYEPAAMSVIGRARADYAAASRRRV